ncbi:uncharacterized protein [Solanum lycopersicum]|uniref:uncharacterized protein n=1 Tax=Solanum lycopersicum TaxID=4081 RepID=UPI003747FE2A
MEEAYSFTYSIHPGSTKINCNTREVYWWESTKMFIVEFVPKYSNCQQVKVEYHRPGGLAQNIQLPEWCYEVCKKGKLSPRYMRPYRLSKRVSNVANELELPKELATVHPVFHISMLKKCMGDPSLTVPTENVGIKDSLSYEEIPV